MPHAEEMSPAERDLRTAALNSSSTIKLLTTIRDRLDAANPRSTPSGFRSGGEFLASVRRQLVDHIPDPRLVVNSVTTFGGETVGGDGGFLMPNDHRRDVLDLVFGTQALLPAFEPIPAKTGLVVIGTDETSEWSSSGVTADIVREGATITPSKTANEKTNIYLVDIPVLSHCTRNLINDNPAYADYLWRKHARKIANKVESLLISGTGQDQPLGVLNAPSRLTLTPIASNANNLGADDVGQMISRLVPGQFSSSFFIAHTSCIVSISKMAPGLFNPAGAGPFGTLANRPLHISEWASPIGTTGDLILVAPAAHPVAVQGPRQEATIEFAFDQDLESFRSILRMGAAPALGAPVARRTGTDTLGAVITLATRS